MATLIKIDKNSIKENKNAGQTSTVVPDPWEYLFTHDGPLPSEIFASEHVYITKTHYQGGEESWVQGVITDRDHAMKWVEQYGLMLEVRRDYQIVYHDPVPKYDYKYQNNQKIKCPDCGEIVSYYSLANYDEYWETEEDNDRKVCPICGWWFVLEYQRIEDII